MKSFLMVAAVLAGLAAPALAEDATTAQPPPPQPQTQAALSPSQEGSVPAALPQSEARPGGAHVHHARSNGPPPARGGGCHHDGQQVYLTN